MLKIYDILNSYPIQDKERAALFIRKNVVFQSNKFNQVQLFPVQHINHQSAHFLLLIKDNLWLVRYDSHIVYNQLKYNIDAGIYKDFVGSEMTSYVQPYARLINLRDGAQHWLIVKTLGLAEHQLVIVRKQNHQFINVLTELPEKNIDTPIDICRKVPGVILDLNI